MTRTVPEWIGASDDTAPPARVILRVWVRDGGICQICQRKLTGYEFGECDHRMALCNGGENRESNLQTLCKWCHRAKTAVDVEIKGRTARVLKKQLGIARKGRPIPGSKRSGWKKPIWGNAVRRDSE